MSSNNGLISKMRGNFASVRRDLGAGGWTGKPANEVANFAGGKVTKEGSYASNDGYRAKNPANGPDEFSNI